MIGVYDSGFGGLTVLKDLIKNMPKYQYMYFGDTLYAPYGDKGNSFIIERSDKVVDFLFNQGAKIVVLACNTVSAISLRHLQMKFIDKYIFDVLTPTSKNAIKYGNNIAVICTTATANSKSFEKAIYKNKSQAKVSVQATPLLVPLIEEGLYRSNFTKYLLEDYLKHFDFSKIDTLVLGCTHYPIIKKLIKNITKVKTIVDSATSISNELYKYIQKDISLSRSLKVYNKSKISFFSTGEASKFKKLGSKILGQKISKVEIINI